MVKNHQSENVKLSADQIVFYALYQNKTEVGVKMQFLFLSKFNLYQTFWWTILFYYKNLICSELGECGGKF